MAKLSDSGLSFTELDIIRESFVKVWRSQNHERIKYPGAKKSSDSSKEESKERV